MPQQPARRPESLRSARGRQGEAADVSRWLLESASSDVPLPVFLRETTRRLLDFVACDVVELWVQRPDRCLRCQVQRPARRAFAVETRSADGGRPAETLLGFAEGRLLSHLCRMILERRAPSARPGNVRELQNLVHGLVVMAEGERIELSDLPRAMRFSVSRQADLTPTTSMRPSSAESPVGVESGGNGSEKTRHKHQEEQGGLIALLEELQLRHGYLPEDELRAVSVATGRSLVDVYGVATFYRAFSLKPRGKHLVCACQGTACHVRGAAGNVKRLEEQLGIAAGETTADGQLTLETANCLGACAVGPVVVIDEHYFSKVRPSQVASLLEEARNGFDRGQPGTAAAFPIDVSCLRCNHSLMDDGVQLDGRQAIRLLTAAGDKQGWLWLSSLYDRPVDGGSAHRRPRWPAGGTPLLPATTAQRPGGQ